MERNPPEPRLTRSLVDAAFGSQAEPGRGICSAQLAKADIAALRGSARLFTAWMTGPVCRS